MDIQCMLSAQQVQIYDVCEVTLAVGDPSAVNPFTDVSVTGQVCPAGGEPVQVDGFCDAADGSVFRVRFMPRERGTHRYAVTYRQGDYQRRFEGSFEAHGGLRRGLVKVDPEHPWHFVWEATDEHWFWNGTTTYWLMGWDIDTLLASVDRLADLGVNRLRVVIQGRVENASAWDEPVVPSERFTFKLQPWEAERPDDLENPGWDVTRFHLPHWRKFDRLLLHARERDVIISVVFYVDGRRPGVDPFRDAPGGEDEQRYYRYAVARFAAYSNVMWDISNEYRLFRDDDWARTLGGFVSDCDPYGHLISVHGFKDFTFRSDAWVDFAMFQRWDEEGGNAYMLANRAEQAATGRIMPQVNEEYGYEEHYPKAWGGGRTAPSRSADSRRRIAWEIAMAGCYQTTGERADTPNGGGWVNGRGDETMTLLDGYRRMVAFFTSFEWWRAEPDNDLATGDALCLAEPGRLYALWLPHGGSTTVSLVPGVWQPRRYDPHTGAWADLDRVDGDTWTSPELPADQDWALLLRRV